VIHLLEVAVRWPPETFLCWKLEGLAERGFRTTVASEQVFDPDARLEGVKLVRIMPRSRRHAGWRVALRDGALLLLRSPRRLARLRRSIRRNLPPAERDRYGGTLGAYCAFLRLARMRPDVVHFEWNTAAVDYLPLFEVWRCPVVTSCHGSDVAIYPHMPSHVRYAAKLVEVFDRAAAVHCVCDALARDTEAFGLEASKRRVIRPGVDPSAFAPRPDPNAAGAALRVVTVGWLRWMKGHEYALTALRELLDRGVPVELDIVGGVPDAVVGSSGEDRRIAHTIADLGLGAHVRLHGDLPTAEVIERLRAADVLLHPSVSEGLPTVLVEALACGLPVVATDVGGVSELVTDGVEGFVIPPRDPAAIADALATLWRDPALRARMGAAGRQTVLDLFTLERQLGEFQELYEEVTRS